MNVIKFSIPRDYYVKLDNILVSDDKQGFKLIQATSGFDLLEKAIQVFDLPYHPYELYSTYHGNQILPTRIDQLAVIPPEHEFILLKVRSYSSSS